jgi:adenylylsulfate kinase
MIVQFTGLSGAGKTTLAKAVQQLLQPHPIAVEIIDGDVYRNTLCKDLGFSRADRCENIRRLGKLAHEVDQPNKVVIIAAINPYQIVRQELAYQYGALTVWVRCSLPVLTQRDTKGLYKRALLPEGHPDKITNLTGVNDAYEPPPDAALVIDTETELPESSADRLYRFILEKLG